ncbi:MAG: hypothetical protein AB8B94_16950, partial [Hyphomicrobiales bacterium]
RKIQFVPSGDIYEARIWLIALLPTLQFRQFFSGLMGLIQAVLRNLNLHYPIRQISHCPEI